MKNWLWNLILYLPHVWTQMRNGGVHVLTRLVLFGLPMLLIAYAAGRLFGSDPLEGLTPSSATANLAGRYKSCAVNESHPHVISATATRGEFKLDNETWIVNPRGNLFAKDDKMATAPRAKVSDDGMLITFSSGTLWVKDGVTCKPPQLF